MNPAMLLAIAAAFVSMAVVFVVKTFADAVFLAQYGVDYLPHFYVAQAAAMITTSFAYTRFIRRRAAVVDAVVLIALAAASLSAPWLSGIGGGAIFGVALMLITLSTLGQLAVWNAVTSVVSGRKSRTFLPKAGAAATAGAVVGGFASSGIVQVGGVTGLAIVSGGLTVGTLIARLVLLKVSSEWRRSGKSSRQSRSESGRSSARRLVQLLAAAVIVEALLSAFIDFGFKRGVTEQFADNTESIGMFFSIYYGVTNVLVLGTQLFTASRLLQTRSLKFTMSMQPASLALVGILWVVFPVLAIGALCRGLEGVMKFAVARPAQEVAMTPLSENRRKGLKVLLRGVFAQSGSAAAGGLLILAAPLLEMNPALVPAACIVFAIAWLALSRATGRHYLATLGSALGLRKMATGDSSDDILDRDGLAKVVELAGHADPALSEFAREMLARYSADSSVLARHIGAGDAATRRTVYELVTARPSKACATRLIEAVSREPEQGGALDAALLALAAHEQADIGGRAETIVENLKPGEGDGLAMAAWTHQSRVGALDDKPGAHRAALRGILRHDGAHAAAAYRAAIARGAVDETEAEDAIDEAVHGDDAGARRQALVAAAVLGSDRCLALVLEEMTSGGPWAEEVAARLSATALQSVFATATGAAPGKPDATPSSVGETPEPPGQKSPARTRARLLCSLRGNERPEVAELAIKALQDEDPQVRDLAVSTLLSRATDSGDVPRAAVERAVGRQMDRFETYVRARPGFGSAARESQMEVRFRQGSAAQLTAEAFFIDELERATETCLQRLCGLLALLGNPESIFAAERALRAPTFKRRRQALDVLQEVARGKQKTRLLELLDLYLMPPRDPPETARAAVCELDPWLARWAKDDDGSGSRRLWALRSALLFDAVDGGSLETLGEHSSEVEFETEQIVVREGDAGDALYIVIDGVLQVERGDKVVAQLGPGEAFGELAMLDGSPRQATVRAQKPTRLLRLPRDTFDKALSEHPEIGLGLVLGLVKWLRQGKSAPRSTLRQTMV